MSANETAERTAAHAWLRAAPESASPEIDPATIAFRSQVGFLDRIITADDAQEYPLVILLLDREMSRRENQVFAQVISTVAADGSSYPQQPNIYSDPITAVGVEPIKLSWLGPDLSAPVWRPFESSAMSPVPSAEELDTFDAIALYLPTVDIEGVVVMAGDVVVHVLKSPIRELGTATTVEAVIPAPPVP